MVVALTPPPDCVNVIGDVNVPPEVVDNSNPVGAVIVILASKPYPVIEKLFSEETITRINLSNPIRQPLPFCLLLSHRLLVYLPSSILF